MFYLDEKELDFQIWTLQKKRILSRLWQPLYKVVLLLHRDWLEEDIAAGEEVDEGFDQYIEEELLRMN